MEQLWKVVAEIEVEPGDLNLESGRTKGFVNVITWANSAESAREKLSRYLASFKWQLLSADDIQPVNQAEGYDEDLVAMVEKAQKNSSAIILGTFHSYRDTIQ